MLQHQDVMTRGTDLAGKPPGENSSPSLDAATRRRTPHTTTSTCCNARDGSVPARHEAGGDRSCVISPPPPDRSSADAKDSLPP